MSDRLLRVIDDALDALPPELLSHVRGEAKPFEGPGLFRAPEVHWDGRADQEGAWQWIREQVRLVLLALERDKRAPNTLARMLPKPWLWQFAVVDLSAVPSDQREEYERRRRERLRQIAENNTKARDQFRDELAKLEQERAEAQEGSAERIDRQLEIVRDDLALIDHTLEELQSTLNGTEPLVPKTCEHRAWYPPAVDEACREAQRQEAKAREKWDKDIWGTPAVWLWFLWRNWHKVLGMPPIPGLPDWPGLDDLSEHDRRHFFLVTALSIGTRINHHPCEALNYLKRALEDLRDRLIEGAGKKKRLAMLILKALLLAGVVITAFAMITHLTTWPGTEWLRNHQNSLRLEIACGLVVLLASLSLFVRPWRKACWKIGIFAVVLVILQLI